MSLATFVGIGVSLSVKDSVRTSTTCREKTKKLITLTVIKINCRYASLIYYMMDHNISFAGLGETICRLVAQKT
jgi:hypothetical protein